MEQVERDGARGSGGERQGRAEAGRQRGWVAQDILVWQGGQGTLKWLRQRGQIP